MHIFSCDRGAAVVNQVHLQMAWFLKVVRGAEHGYFLSPGIGIAGGTGRGARLIARQIPQQAIEGGHTDAR